MDELFQIVDALHVLRPGASWTIVGRTLEGLEWTDLQQSRPSDEEIRAQF